MNKIILGFLILQCTISTVLGRNTVSVSSPDLKTKIEIIENKQKKLQYRVLYCGREAVKLSCLGLKTNVGTLGENTSIVSGNMNQVNEKFPWSLGENDTIVNLYNETTVSGISVDLPFEIQVRVYNGAIAFRYKISKAQSKSVNRIQSELTTFAFPSQAVLYQYNQESVFMPTALDTLRKTSDLPTTIQCGGLYYSIGEAENTCYTKAELKKGTEPNTLSITLAHDSELKITDEFKMPWRTIALSETAIGLHDFSDLYLKLNSSTLKEVPAWIKPGKLIRSQLNTQSGLDCIDFAVKHNLRYIMFDAGWYGHEFRTSSDPTQVIEQIDLPKIISYGKVKGVGVILYVNKVGLYQKLDSILPLYKRWGVAGLKFGFVDGLTQEGMSWLNQAMTKVNNFGFILDIHDNYKPTGLSRKYPCLLTQEGIRGDENSPDAFHTTVLPFTRYLAGPADFTFCYPNSKDAFSKNLKVSKAHQLALSVIYFSPLQSLYWYGKPLDYKNDEEIEFFDKIPTVWNESHYLAGEIGKNISVARRNGQIWFLGNVAGLVNWTSSVELDFLSGGQKYEATIYEDNGVGGICKRILPVRKGEVFSFDIKACCGQSVIFRPVR